MTRRVRSAKTLASRIDLGYFRRSHPLARWLSILSLAAPLVALGWLGWHAVAGGPRIYSGGPLSAAHAAFGDRCELCHTGVRGQLGRAVDDGACLACHDGALHHETEPFTPACTSCHMEHGGAVRLAATADGACASCHRDLTTAAGSSRFARSIEDFGSDHPEFAVLSDGGTDGGTIRFNHRTHLRPDLRGAAGPEPLRCASCHEPAGDGGERMEPVRYETHCARCHVLLFDERVAEPAPHAAPAVVRAFVVARLGAGSEERTAAAERVLWRKTCHECHGTLAQDGAHLPVVAPAAIAQRWLPHAEFDHRPHRMLACTACHSAPASEKTGDVLLPGIATCRACHHTQGADASCAGCHRYHDRRREREPPAQLTIEQVARRG